MNVQDAPGVKDLQVSSKNKTSYHLRVSKTDVMFVEVLPFLTQSQMDAGFMSTWFSQHHLQELMLLLRSHLIKTFQHDQATKGKDSQTNKQPRKNFILSGDHLRAACNYKSHTETDYHLIPIKRGNGANFAEKRFQEVTMLKEKMLIYVCPRSSSSMLHLSQLITSDKENLQGESEDISKYFQPVS